MAEITLSDYVGYIFSEIVRARVIADGESQYWAQVYQQNEVLKNFSIPRFKVPEMELTIPVLIAGARFSNTYAFLMKQEDFSSFIEGKLRNAVRSILIKRNQIEVIVVKPIPFPVSASKKASLPLKADSSQGAITEFFNQLVNNPDPIESSNIIQEKWYSVFWKRMDENKMIEDYKKFYSNNELFLETLADVTNTIKQNIALSNTKIKNLLVNPETNVVKNGSDETSVFVVKAKIMEEGIFIKTVKDEDSGQEKQVVDFE